MSKDEGRHNVAKRFFVQSNEGVWKELQHLAIDFDTSAEKLGGALVAWAAAQAKAGRVSPDTLRLPPAKPKSK